MIINLTQHPATPEQLIAGVIDLPPAARSRLCDLLTFDDLPSRAEVEQRAELIADFAMFENGIANDDEPDFHPSRAMLGGAPFLMAALERALHNHAVYSVYAFSVRESSEQIQPDGSTRKINVFRHAGFV